MKHFFTFCVLSIGVFAQSKLYHFPDEMIESRWWNKNLHRNILATAEIFIRVQDFGKYRVFVGNQGIGSSSGMYRSFNSESKKQSLLIYEGKRFIYGTMIHSLNNHCLILNYNHFDGLSLLDEICLVNQNYYNFPPVFQNKFHKKGANYREFQKFFEQYQKTTFSDEKLKLFEQRNTATAFTSEQIVRLMEEFSFDKEKIIIAKKAFENCIDPENYDQVIQMLDFNSSRKELVNFIKQHYQ